MKTKEDVRIYKTREDVRDSNLVRMTGFKDIFRKKLISIYE